MIHEEMLVVLADARMERRYSELMKNISKGFTACVSLHRETGKF